MGGCAFAMLQAPLRGITPIIEFIAETYGNRYAPNTRETWVKDLEDGSKAIGFFNRSRDALQATVNLKELGLAGNIKSGISGSERISER